MTTLSTALDTGLNWLYETAQPDDAHQQHHGIVLHLPEANRWYGFCPTGANNLPVVSVDVIKVEHKLDGDGDYIPANPLKPDELAALATELEQRGYTVASTWNGHPGVTGSCGLRRPAHPTLVAAVDRYRRGCVVHPERSVFCNCEAWRAESNRIVRPPLPPTV
jgi:hypothetical protein